MGTYREFWEESFERLDDYIADLQDAVPREKEKETK